MATRYSPKLDLAQRLLHEQLVSRIWDRAVGLGGPPPALPTQSPSLRASARRRQVQAPRSVSSTVPDASSISLCRLLPGASIVTIAGK
jgi:hypothetical protein